MAYRTFAAIYVGSSEVAMKIFQITPRRGFKEVDFVQSIIELGKDTYVKGEISIGAIKYVCEILNNFKQKMREYEVVEYRAFATSAVREASNCAIILDAIKTKTAIKVSILSNSEQRFINYKGIVAKIKDYQTFISKNSAFVDVGAGSVQISLFDKNNIIATQNIPIGSVRVRDYLSILGSETVHLDKVIEEFIVKDIIKFRNIYLNEKELKSIVATGEIIQAMKRILPEFIASEKISRSQVAYIYEQIKKYTPEEISKKYGIPYERATLMLPNIIIYQSFLDNSKAEEIIVPNVDFCDGIVADYMDIEKQLVLSKNFEEDISATAYSIAKRYKSSRSHIQNVAVFALEIFDALKKTHYLGKNERTQLEISAVLHEVGNFINMNEVAENSYNIISATEILGLSHRQRIEVANIVKYNYQYLPSEMKVSKDIGKCKYTTIAKLAAILRIADVLDISHKQKFSNIRIVNKEGKMYIHLEAEADVTLEKGLFEERAEFFEKVFGIRPELKLKRGV